MGKNRWEIVFCRYLDPRVPPVPEVAGPIIRSTSWTWCNGRSGMLLARAAVAEALGRRFEDGLAMLALQAPADDDVRSRMPGLCCGPAGILDAALEVEARSEGGALREVIDCAASHLLDGMPESLLDPLNGTLFAGAAGAAFALLRSVPSLRVPSLLWFE